MPMSKIEVSEKRLLITAVNMTSAQILAFSINGLRNFSLAFRFVFPLYQTQPQIFISRKLTKVLVVGPFIPPN